MREDDDSMRSGGDCSAEPRMYLDDNNLYDVEHDNDGNWNVNEQYNDNNRRPVLYHYDD